MSLEAKEDRTLARLVTHMKAVRDNWASVVAIKDGLRREDGLMVKECWQELDYQTQCDLWHAPTYGGVWETWEREAIEACGSLTTSHLGLLSFEIYRVKLGRGLC